MLQRSPCELYIKYLMLLPENLSDEAIVSLLRAQRLDWIGADYLQGLRARLRPPSGFRPTDRLHNASQTFLLKTGVQDLFRKTPSVVAALKVLERPRVKEFIESMTISGAPVPSIALSIEKQWNRPFGVAALQAYIKYFWNLEYLESAEVKILLYQRFHGGHLGPLAKGAELAYKTDPRKTATELPHSPISAMLAQLRLGFMPRTEDLKNVLEHARAAAALRTYEASMAGGPFSSKTSYEYTATVEKLGQILEQIVNPDDQLHEHLRAIRLRVNQVPQAKGLFELSSGNHSAEVEVRSSETASSEAVLDVDDEDPGTS